SLVICPTRVVPSSILFPYNDALPIFFVGRPLASSEQEHQRLSKAIALPIFSSDAISSTAYATEEILFVAVAGTSSLALGQARGADRKSTRLNSSHSQSSYAVCCFNKK